MNIATTHFFVALLVIEFNLSWKMWWVQFSGGVLALGGVANASMVFLVMVVGLADMYLNACRMSQTLYLLLRRKRKGLVRFL